MDHDAKALEIVGNLWRTGPGLDQASVAMIAATLREVELDALERAADVADHQADRTLGIAQNIAVAIRALTSAGPSSGSSRG